jgi:hypothetical protein
MSQGVTKQGVTKQGVTSQGVTFTFGCVPNQFLHVR